MIVCMIQGTLIRDPERRISKNGNEFATALVKTDENQIVSVMAFGELADLLADLRRGDALSVIGTAQLSVYTAKDTGETRPGLSLTASRIMALVDKAATGKPKKARPMPQEEHQEPFDDPIPF